MACYQVLEEMPVNRQELVRLAGLHALLVMGAGAVPQGTIARQIIV